MTHLVKKPGRFRTFLVSVFFCLFGFHPVWAEDTEIYFAPVTGSNAQPNILLVLDASASMLDRDGGPTTRLQRMRDAMTQVLNQVGNVNIGVMRFSNRNSGSSVIYPVRDIESFLCDGIPCDTTVGFNGSITSVRQEILDTITNMEMQWETPTVGAILEAEAYFSGADVVFGSKRIHNPCDTRTGNDKTRCEREIDVDGTNTGRIREDGRVASVSHPDSYTGGVLINRPEICDEDPTDPACIAEEITGNAVYTSPIANECQSNHILLVSDGEASEENASVDALKRFGTCEIPGLRDTRGTCAIEVADFMANNDLIDTIDGVQSVTTHTVGFNLDSPWLERIASGKIGDDGAGGYFTANSTEDLVNTLVEIIESVQRVDATFAAPGITVDQFSRLSHRRDTYLALFEPANTPQWPGNLKRYDLLSGGALFDASNPQRRAVNSATGTFEPNTRSYWSTANDGHSISAGGAASRLPTYSNRKTVTYNGTQDSLFHAINEISTNNINNLVELGEDDATNLAPGGVATQGSISHGGSPGRAIDSNTNGRYRDRSVTHTQNGSGAAWWQLDLLETFSINDINIFGRTDCCTDRLSDVNVYVSDTPFGNASNDEIKANPLIWRQFHNGEIDQDSRPYTVSPNRNGRYVRIALDDPNTILSLAEVQVMGGRVSDTEIARVSNIVEWVRGKDVKDEDNDNVTNEMRNYIGDPLHSSPHIVNYGGTADNPDSVIFFGTNEGFIHAISSQTGSEEFAFMPRELIPNLDILFENSTFSDKVYGMDGDITSWIKDNNNNGNVDALDGDHAFLYTGMRRGGSSYYALDVTDRADPKFLFNIPEVDPVAYAELGQTWSEPTVASIKVGNETKTVLIFAGGYDESQDDKTIYSPDYQGNTTIYPPDSTGRAIFIADAEDGSLIWSGQLAATAGLPIKSFPDMQYSIPSDINVIDPDGDGLASQFYVGDMGGQLWRFDINNGSTGKDLVDGGVIAQFGEQTQSGARRFFHRPDLVLSKFEGEIILNIGIGSGYQAHPLDHDIKDRFYQIRYPLRSTGNYGIKNDQPNEPPYRPITEDDMFNVTDVLVGQGTDQEIQDAQDTLSGSQGWLIRMERSGEKILGASSTLDGVVRFISYVPSGNSVNDRCTPNIGQSFFYRVGLRDGAPPEDRNSDGNVTKEDRYTEVPGGGIAPAVTTVFVADETTGDVVPTDVSGINVLNQGSNVNTIRRWYWAENPE